MQQKNQLASVACWVFHALFYGAVLAVIGFGLFEPVDMIPPELFHRIAKITQKEFQAPGFKLGPLIPFLPKKGTISFLTDHPYPENKEEELFYQDAQNTLAPLILNPRPGEPVGIIYCSSGTAAEYRLAQTGYGWVIRFTDRMGIVQKNQ